jgi:hypothetical protein
MKPLPTSKVEEVSQNCSVVDVVNFAFLIFLRTSRRLSSFWSCELGVFEEVSQYYVFVLKDTVLLKEA